MKLSYYPGCTLKSTAKNFEESTLCALQKLDIQVEEINRWNCCGTVFSLATDDLMHHLAPIRNLIRVKEANSNRVMTVCAMCYNTLKRANEFVKKNRADLELMNQFMDQETVTYEGDVEVMHLLEILKNEVTFSTLAQKVSKPLTSLKIACYYGCYLVRPKGIGFDDPENPVILEDFMSALGAKTIDFPYKTECCAAYQTVTEPEIVAQRTYQILSAATSRDADLVAVSCPLCAFNLDHRQKLTAQLFPDFKHIPILYFSQAMALALGCPIDSLRADLHYINPLPLLKEKGLI